ncbi:hypothetical protein DKX38_015722 [Salix brachista]|uniref:glutamine--tRNA ligase n=1 Tax=Salix brachista TaxID=2182728 RepID=A0A5N5L609_9ROSI|nr:hypothetical protein DKX38_015722 [Salix brachista]
MAVKEEERLELFLKIGLDERTARNTIANNKVTNNLNAVIHEVATKYPANALVHRPALLGYIVTIKIKTPAQLEAAFSFLSSTASESFELKEFEEACGVGVEVSEEDIEQTVNEVSEQNKGSILELRYRTNVGDLFGLVRKRLPWADPKIVKVNTYLFLKEFIAMLVPEKLIDAKLYELLGGRTAADNEKALKQKKEKPAKVKDKKAADDNPSQPSEDLNPFLIFPNPEENFKVHTEIFFSDQPVLRCCNTKEVLDKHLKRTSGKVYTRFPPEPNGYLHIGHAKAMFVSFGLAKERGGCCYLRYDDTNPEAEKKEYIDHIEEIVEWMGWKPLKITYTSDYFQELYELAVELIQRGHAYVDHQTPEEIKEYREKKMNSPWRDRPIAESLKLFEEMRQGMIEEGKATLRMKQDMQSDNGNILLHIHIQETSGASTLVMTMLTALWILWRTSHIRSALWNLRPGVLHTTGYYMYNIYQPYVWEYSRLNVTNNVMSKRKLNFLVTKKLVDGWDDPRLMTLAGLRRRGVTSTAINAFVRGIGITRSDCCTIRLERLEYHIREELNRTAPRTMVVLQPLKVVITNLDSGLVMDLDAKKWPDTSTENSSAFYKVPFSRVVYIEQSDFRMKDSKDYYGLAPGKSVLLRYAFPIKCTEVVLADDDETIVEIWAEYDHSKKTKPKGVIHWVSEPSREVDSLSIEVRLFDKLFNSENPAELGDWLADVNLHSKVVIYGAYAVPSLRDAAIGDRFQFERLGYFVVDKDSTSERLVFNRTVTLRDSYGKSGNGDQSGPVCPSDRLHARQMRFASVRVTGMDGVGN